MKSKSKTVSGEIAYDKPLPSLKLEKGSFIATILYQIPNRILLHGRVKTSPNFETLYGVIYWLNKQPYNMEYSIYRTDKDESIREGFKKVGEIIK
jgi:hypothetical protein